MMWTIRIRRVFGVGLLALLVMLTGSTCLAQTPRVQLDLQFPSFDVIYLSDIIDPVTGKLASSVPNFALNLRTDPPGQTISLYLVISAKIKLQGDAGYDEVLSTPARTEPFDLFGSRTITSRDLRGGLSDIKVDVYEENQAVKDRLENYAKRFPTAPVGTYIVQVKVFSAVTDNPLGSASKTITVQNASSSEVQVTLVDPPAGAVLATPFPTFSWTSEKPEVTLYVYEKLPIHRSPQEAITGIPYLKQEISGAQVFTYPANAPRRLQDGRSYYWFVETSVTTNRGVEKRQSDIRMFRVRADNALAQTVEQLLNQMGGAAAGTIATLIQMGWNPSPPVTMDSRTLSREELIALLSKLASEGTKVQIHVESQ
jgi:hypothetical protein